MVDSRGLESVLLIDMPAMNGGLNETNLILSIFLVLILMIVSRVRKVLNEAGTWAAAILGLGVAIAGHWSWLIILLSFLTAGFAATKWRYSEKSEKGFNEGTAFEILSIDIADLDVGKNVGAQLQTDQAEADLRVSQARAETRRAMAVAEEQEMRAKTQEMQAKVVESESQVPLAMAQAFREGKLGVFDYVNMKNIQADTDMRESISGGSDSGTTSAPERDND